MNLTVKLKYKTAKNQRKHHQYEVDSMMRLKGILTNEYVRTIILLAIIIVSIAGLWLGLRAFLRTDYPLLAVASGSMEPTLNEGDLIIVQGGLDATAIVAEEGTGDVIVFHKPGDPNELIVHRAVRKWQDGDLWKFETKGDHNTHADYWTVFETDIVGKVVWVVPYIGNIPLFVHTENGMMIIVALIVLLVALEFVIPFIRERKKPEPDQPKEETDPNMDSL